MKVVYVAGPFRCGVKGAEPRVQDAWGIQTNVMAAMALALEVWKLGAVAICPHANTMFFQNAAGCADEVWLNGDLELLNRCDAMIVTDDWQRSSGARAEVQHAEARGLPVFLTLEDLAFWLNAQESAVPACGRAVALTP